MGKFKFGLLILLFILCLQGCTLFFGNIKPVEEKASDYRILDLSKEDAVWARLGSHSDSGVDPNSAADSSNSESGISDMAFQSKKTASIISINSACKTFSSSGGQKTLEELSHELLLGISDITLQKSENRVIEGSPALQTTLQGKLNRENMMLRAVVFQKGNCVYDLMYIARPERFQEDEAIFSRFLSSLRLK